MRELRTAGVDASTLTLESPFKASGGGGGGTPRGENGRELQASTAEKEAGLGGLGGRLEELDTAALERCGNRALGRLVCVGARMHSSAFRALSLLLTGVDRSASENGLIVHGVVVVASFGLDTAYLLLEAVRGSMRVSCLALHLGCCAVFHVLHVACLVLCAALYWLRGSLIGTRRIVAQNRL